MKLLGIISEGLEVTDQLLIRFFEFVKYRGRGEFDYNEVVDQLFQHFKKAYDSFRKDYDTVLWTQEIS
jgi:hypothetical protein